MASTKLLTSAELVANRFAVLATYRHVLRATAIAFKDDAATLSAARSLARDNFQKNRRLEVGGVEVGNAVEHAQGVAQILRENVVQGEHKGGETYRLNIHEHTQRLDNGSASELKGTTKSFQEIKNARF